MADDVSNGAYGGNQTARIGDMSGLSFLLRLVQGGELVVEGADGAGGLPQLKGGTELAQPPCAGGISGLVELIGGVGGSGELRWWVARAMGEIEALRELAVTGRLIALGVLTITTLADTGGRCDPPCWPPSTANAAP